MASALAPSSSRAYSAAWGKFISFACSHGLPFSVPVPLDHLLWFCTYLSNKGLSHSSILPMMSAISYAHKLQAAPDPTKSFRLQQLLVSLKRRAPSADDRQPITHDILSLILSQLSAHLHSVYERLLFRAIFTSAFHFGLRLGEFTESRHNLPRESVSISSVDMRVSFGSFKHSTGSPVVHTIGASGEPHCPVAAMSAYLAFRGSTQGPLFLLGGSAVKRHVFNAQFKALLRQCGLSIRLTSHSFRIGAATWWSHLNYSEAKIKQLGRWRSNAFLKYLRGPVSHPSY